MNEYRMALGRWLNENEAEKPIDAKISGFLGEITERKEGIVKDILGVIESGEIRYQQLMTLCEDACKMHMGASFNPRARPLHCFDCPGSHVKGDKIPNCSCFQGIIIDACLICTRINDSWSSVVREYRRFPEEYILAYAMAVNSWLTDEPKEPVTSLIKGRYLTEEIAAEIPIRVHALVGRKEKAKEWLATSLLKTLKGNQRWHDKEELIDNIPGATSYLKEISTID